VLTLFSGAAYTGGSPDAVLTVQDEVSTMMGSRALGFSRPRRRGFTLIEMLVVIVIIMILAAILIPTVMKAICQGRQATMEAMMSSLTQACKSYELDSGVYPESNGAHDSAGLAKSLTKPSKRNSVYYEFKESQIDRSGNIVNSIHPEEDTVKYRNNVGVSDPKAKGHNKYGVDLWCMGCDKMPDSVNNWD
jgi:type II secretion system protein G